VSAKVFDFEAKRKAMAKPSLEQLIADCSEDLLGNWERFARNNRLNQFFISSVPTWVNQHINYLDNLTELSQLEIKVGLEPQVVSPGFTTENLGWIAAFRINGKVVSSPFMISECYARCFNVLMYLKLKRELVTNGISVTI
jgi:hypothetical protein